MKLTGDEIRLVEKTLEKNGAAGCAACGSSPVLVGPETILVPTESDKLTRYAFLPILCTYCGHASLFALHMVLPDFKYKKEKSYSIDPEGNQE